MSSLLCQLIIRNHFRFLIEISIQLKSCGKNFRFLISITDIICLVYQVVKINHVSFKPIQRILFLRICCLTGLRLGLLETEKWDVSIHFPSTTITTTNKSVSSCSRWCYHLWFTLVKCSVVFVIVCVNCLACQRISFVV